MEKGKFELWMMEYLSDELDDKGRRAFEKFLKDHPSHKEKFDGLQQTWNDLENLEAPKASSEMDTRFFNILHSEIEEQQKSSEKPKSWLSTFLEGLWRPQVAYRILLLFMGLSLGYFLKSDNPSVDYVKTTVLADEETADVRAKLVLTLLDQPSANKRLQGINEVNKINRVDATVINALLQTLNNDANVNVRLAAIESLTNYLDNPLVREGLVQSIVQQDAPIVQITLANLMVALQEKKSIEPFKKLIQTKELDKTVKEKLETTINSII